MVYRVAIPLGCRSDTSSNDSSTPPARCRQISIAGRGGGMFVVESALDPPGPIPNPVVTQRSAGEYLVGDCLGGEATASIPPSRLAGCHPAAGSGQGVAGTAQHHWSSARDAARQDGSWRGVEQWQLVGLITQRSGVRIPPPQPNRDKIELTAVGPQSGVDGCWRFHLRLRCPACDGPYPSCGAKRPWSGAPIQRPFRYTFVAASPPLVHRRHRYSAGGNVERAILHGGQASPLPPLIQRTRVPLARAPR